MSPSKSTEVLINITFQSTTHCQFALPTATPFQVQPFAQMTEYKRLGSTSPTQYEVQETESLIPDASQQHDVYTIRNRTALPWWTLLMAVISISAAAALHIRILSTTSRLKAIRSPPDVVGSLRMVSPSPNLAKGTKYMKQRKVKGELR